MIGRRLVEQVSELGGRLGQPDPAELGHPPAEVNLVTVDDFTELRQPRDHDGQLVHGPGFGDGARATVADDDVGRIHQGTQFLHLEEARSGAVRGHRCGP
jgi:hypothetical protein